MNVLEQLRRRAAARIRRIVFPESSDSRVIEAANFFQREGLGQALVVSNAPIAELDPGIEIVSPEDAELRAAAIAQLVENRKHKGMDQSRATEALSDPLLFAALPFGGEVVPERV